MTMNSYEHNTLPFVIKIWLKDRGEPGAKATWHGQITHVPSGKHATVKGLDDIGVFVIGYLEKAGIRAGYTWRIRRLLTQWCRSKAG